MPKYLTIENSADTPQPEFDSKKVYKGGVLGLMALRAVNGKGGALSERLAKRIIAKDSTVAGREVASESMAKVEAVSKQTEYWHGTGR